MRSQSDPSCCCSTSLSHRSTRWRGGSSSPACWRRSTETGITVVLSSHIVADLERICDRLIILALGRTQLAGPIDEILAGHRLLTGPRTDAAAVARVHEVIRESHTERQTSLLVRANGHVYDTCWEAHEVDLEEIVLAYLGMTSAAPRMEAPAAVAR